MFLYILINFYNMVIVRKYAAYKIGKKIVRPRDKFFESVPNWHFSQLSLFAIFCAIENLSHPTARTP